MEYWSDGVLKVIAQSSKLKAESEKEKAFFL
jgi:hypothetical protein